MKSTEGNKITILPPLVFISCNVLLCLYIIIAFVKMLIGFNLLTF